MQLSQTGKMAHETCSQIRKPCLSKLLVDVFFIYFLPPLLIVVLAVKHRVASSEPGNVFKVLCEILWNTQINKAAH